jgi:hypothetical protein
MFFLGGRGEPERAEGVQRPLSELAHKMALCVKSHKRRNIHAGHSAACRCGEASHYLSFDPDASGHTKAFVPTSFESCLETFFLFCVTNQM